MTSVSPPGLEATSRPVSSRTTHGGLIQFSGLYALASACTAMEPSAFNRISRGAGGSRAPSRPWYSTEQFATSMRTPRVVPQVRARARLPAYDAAALQRVLRPGGCVDGAREHRWWLLQV